MSVNDKLLKAIRDRQEKKTQFNYGILTADRYVKTVQDAVGLDFCYRHMSKSTASFSDLMQKASSTLVYSNEDMVVEDGKFDMNGIELPKNCLMVFKHVLTTPRKDRDGDILRTEGMNPDPKMLLIWQHVHTMPLGKMLAVYEHSTKALRLVSCIVDMNSLCHDAAVMVDNKMGRFSHGFRAIKFGKVKEAPGEAEGGFDIKEAEIMEESLVSVPANPDAETEEVLLSLVEGGKLTSPVMKRMGKGIRGRRPVSVPVVLDLKVSVNGQEIKNAEGQGKSVGGGIQGKTGSSEEADEVLGENPGGEKGSPADAQVKGIPYASLPGSWEHVESVLRSKAEKFLADAGKIKSIPVDQPRNYWVGTVATFQDHAIVGVENFMSAPSDTYYKCSWHAGPDGKPEFYGEPKEVEVSVSTTIREKGLLAKAKEAWTKAKADPKENEDEEKESKACPKCGSEDIVDGVCQDCGYELKDGEKPDEEDEKPSKSVASGEKKGRVLSRDNEGRIKEAMEYLDEGHKMDGVPKPCKACIGHAKGNLGTVLETLGAEGEASQEPEKREITVDEAAVLFIASASPEHRSKMLGLLKGLEQIDTMEKNTKEFLALKGR